MKTIGMIVAMTEETKHILEHLGHNLSDVVILGFRVMVYNVMDKKIVLINSGIGEINAAAATMLAIEKYNVEVIINFGLAGSLCDDIKVNELLLAKDIVHYDFDISAFGKYKKAQYVDMDTAEIPCDKNLINIVKGIMDIRTVRIASGDKFIGSKKERARLRKDFSADICEMESAAIIRIASKANIPCIFIKSISDNADESAESDIQDTIDLGIHTYSDLIAALIKVL